MKIILGAVAFVLAMLLGHQQKPMCMDPNANIPIDCSLLK